ncbi:sel1 repeat family protein [Celeribacter sp. HF31]|nr:sel1 repeat family protein [Celeribacter sp. HF31]
MSIYHTKTSVKLRHSRDENIYRRASRGQTWTARAALLLGAGLCVLGAAAVAQTPASFDLDAAQTALWSEPDADQIATLQADLEAAAASGDVAAQHLLGQHLLNGWVLPQDVPRGLSLLETLAETGHVGALTDLGQAYLWGTALPADPDVAVPYLERAATNGGTEAQRILGEQMIGGWVLPRDVTRGQAYLDQAISGGDVEARIALGKLQLYGIGVPKDEAAALAQFEAAAEAGNGHGLAAYGDALMWEFTDPPRAEALLQRAGEMGASEAWVSLARGAMYGYLGGGSVSRAKFDGYAEKALNAGEEDVAVLEATRQMWGINMRASGPETIAILREAAEGGNAAAARFLIALLRDGNGLNLRRDRAEAAAALDQFGPLLSDKEQAQYALTLRAATARTPKAYAPVAADYAAHPELHSGWFAQELLKANPNVAVYILQKQFAEEGLYRGALDGFATRQTLRAVYKACLGLEHPERCNDSVMRSDIMGALLVN